MLPIYDAISFNKILVKGGRTEPWLIYVNVAHSRIPYVVKLFTVDEVEHNDCLAREVFCSILASEFDLSTPEPALINFSDSFIATLPVQASNILAFRDDRLKFGCKYYPNTTLLNNALPKGQISKILNDIGSIFAFDNLILNKDRGQYKTNLLIDLVDDRYFLIDHECALKGVDKKLTEIESNNFNDVIKTHVLYKYLIASKHKSNIFDTFNFYLSGLNPNVFDAYNSQLISQNIVYSLYEQFKLYICTIKERNEWFSNILRNSL